MSLVDTHKLPDKDQKCGNEGHHEMVENNQFSEIGSQDNEVSEEAKCSENLEKKQSHLERFWETLHEWATITTFHGMRYVFDQSSHFFRRAIWFVLIMCCIVFLVWNGQAQMNRYFEYRPLTVQTTKVHEKLLFPSVTICISDFIRNDSVTNDTERILIEELLQAAPNRTQLLTEIGETKLKSASFRDLLQKHITKLDEFILLCTWKGNPFDCSEYFDSRLAEDGLCYTIKTTLDPFESVVAGDMYGLEITLRSGHETSIGAGYESYGMKVLVHEATDEPNMETASLIGPGFIYHIPVTTHVFNYLPYPVAAFGGQYCIDTTEDVLLHGHYTITGCYKECRREFILKHCGCISHFDEENKDIKECSAYKIMDCYHPTLVSFMSQIEKCHCATPCHITKYSTKLSSTFLPDSTCKAVQKKLQTSEPAEILKENLLILKIFYESKEVTYTEQILEFTFEDLWASFGGYLGIAVGASLLTFVEILDLIATSVYRHLRRIRGLFREAPTP